MDVLETDALWTTLGARQTMCGMSLYSNDTSNWVSVLL